MATPLTKNGSKNVCWTLFDWTDEQLALIRTCVSGGHAKYLVFGRETCPETSKKHLQGYSEFTKRMSWPAIRKLWNVGNIGQSIRCATRYGTPQQASDYCKKDGDFEEFGVITPEGEGQGKRSDLLALKEHLDAGMPMTEIADAHFGSYMRYGKGIAAYKLLKTKPRTQNTICVVVYGASNAGKTRWVETTFPGACWITKGAHATWFDNYNQETVTVFDEFHGGFFPFSFFKRLIDATPLSVDSKLGSKPFTSRICVFLSNDAPDTWWHDLSNANLDAFNRRLHFVFEAQKIMQLGNNGSSPTGNFQLRVHKTILPWNAAVFSEWHLSGLTHDESVSLLDYNLDSQARKLLNDRTPLKSLPGSVGVIMTPTLEKILSQKLDFCSSLGSVWVQLMGQDDVPAAAPVIDLPLETIPEPVESLLDGRDNVILHDSQVEDTGSPTERDEEDECEDLSAPSALLVALKEYEANERIDFWSDMPMPSPDASSSVPRPVRHDQVLKRNLFKSNYPELTWDDVAVLKSNRVPPPDAPERALRRTRRRRNPKCPFVDAECEEKGHTEAASDSD